jgi:hypothetical protein
MDVGDNPVGSVDGVVCDVLPISSRSARSARLIVNARQLSTKRAALKMTEECQRRFADRGSVQNVT